MGDIATAMLSPAAIYLVPLLALMLVYFRSRNQREDRALRDLQRMQATGATEPVSIHPVINGNRCLGCGSCVDACPHGDVLGVVGGQAELVNPTN